MVKNTIQINFFVEIRTLRDMEINIKTLDAEINALANRISELNAITAAHRVDRASNEHIRVEMQKCLQTIERQKRELDSLKIALEKLAEEIDNHVSRLLQMIKVIFKLLSMNQLVIPFFFSQDSKNRKTCLIRLLPDDQMTP